MWVLTESFNDYDQHGDYLRRAWVYKPTLEMLTQALAEEEGTGDVDELAQHVYAGGGRQHEEYNWYYLKEVRPGERYDSDT